MIISADVMRNFRLRRLAWHHLIPVSLNGLLIRGQAFISREIMLCVMSGQRQVILDSLYDLRHRLIPGWAMINIFAIIMSK